MTLKFSFDGPVRFLCAIFISDCIEIEGCYEIKYQNHFVSIGFS